jgi:MFS family permease
MSTMVATSDEQAQKAVTGAFFGFFVDMFDVLLLIIMLAPAQIYFQPPSVPANVTAVAASLVIAATLLGRPLGSVIFDYLSDQISRGVSKTTKSYCDLCFGQRPTRRRRSLHDCTTLWFLR